MLRCLPVCLLFFAFACTSPNALLVCASGGDTCVALATSTTGMGSLGRVDLTSGTTTLDLDTLDADTTMQVIADEIFVLQRQSGQLRIYDSKTLTLKGVPLDTGDAAHPAAMSKPRDFWVDDIDNVIWVSLSGNEAAFSLGSIDRGSNTIQYLGLPQDAADPDGKPEPDTLYPCNYKMYVTLKSSTTAIDGTITYGQGRVAIVEPDNRRTTGVLPLAGTNPVDIQPIDGNCNDTAITSGSTTATAPDGSALVERYDLGAGASHGAFITDTQLGGRPTFTASAGSDRLFIVSHSGGTAKVVLYSIAKRQLVGDITGAFSDVPFLRIHDAQVFFGAGSGTDTEPSGVGARGLYIGPDDGSIITSAPIDLQLTPTAIALP